MKIPVVDVFAGPGGLGEGFSSFYADRYHPFEIKMSVEKDPLACRTLKLRSFFRKVHFDLLKPQLVKFLKSERTVENEETLQLLTEMGVDLVQGNYLGHPGEVPVDSKQADLVAHPL